jgi:predicted nucleic-acid-binding Zn-ribbon protein
MQKSKSYTVDLSKIEGKGEFKCPKCRTEISPDDTSETTYTIIEPVVRSHSLEKIVIQCNRCGSTIKLVGFQNPDYIA